jgi:hypothetical protein
MTQRNRPDTGQEKKHMGDSGHEEPERRWEIGDGGGREMVVVARGRETIDLAQAIYDRCDECLQAWDMLEFFPGRPELHTTSQLHGAMLAAGCEIDDGL